MNPLASATAAKSRAEPPGASLGSAGVGARKPPRKAESPSRHRGGLPGDPAGTNRQAVTDVAPQADNAQPENRVDSAEAWGRARLDTYCTKWVTPPELEADESRCDAMWAKAKAWEARALQLDATAGRLRDHGRTTPAAGASADMRLLAGKLGRKAKHLRGRVKWARSSMATLTEGCGEPTQAQVQCGCARRWVEKRCGQKWSCKRCKKRWTRRLRARMWQAMGGRTDRCYLVTPTVRHSGDPSADWDRLQRGWRVFRRWLARHLDGAPEYVRLWEATNGRDDLGHVHCHAVVYATRIDYGQAREAWRRAMRDPDAVIDFQVVKNAKQAVRYVSKYVSKGVDLACMSPKVAGKLQAAAYGRRMVSSSRSFFAPYVAKCSRCACCFSAPFRAPWEASVRASRASDLIFAYATGGDWTTAPP